MQRNARSPTKMKNLAGVSWRPMMKYTMQLNSSGNTSWKMSSAMDLAKKYALT